LVHRSNPMASNAACRASNGWTSIESCAACRGLARSSLWTLARHRSDLLVRHGLSHCPRDRLPRPDAWTLELRLWVAAECRQVHGFFDRHQPLADITIHGASPVSHRFQDAGGRLGEFVNRVSICALDADMRRMLKRPWDGCEDRCEVRRRAQALSRVAFVPRHQGERRALDLPDRRHRWGQHLDRDRC